MTDTLMETRDTSQLDPKDVILTLNGFPLYGTDSYGVSWHTTFQQISGLFDGVGSTLETASKAWTDGLYSNIPTRDGRTITIEGLIYGACPEDLIKAWERFKATFALNDQLLTVQLGSINRQLTVKQSTSAPLIRWNGLTVLKWSISLISLSSYLYAGGDPTTGSTGLPFTSGGFSYPVSGYGFGRKRDKSDTDWYFGETQVSGVITLLSNGGAPAPVTMRVDGPVINPVITHEPSGRVMALDLTLGSGTYILFDGDRKQILLNGADPLRGHVLRREWSYAYPGTNRWAFSADEPNSEAKLTVSFRAAYI